MGVKHKAVKVKGEVLRAEEWNEDHDAPLSALDDVEITTPADKEVLTFESATGLWTNKPAPAVTPIKQFFEKYLTADFSLATPGTWYDVLTLTADFYGGYVETHVLPIIYKDLGPGDVDLINVAIRIDGVYKRIYPYRFFNPATVEYRIYVVCPLIHIEKLTAGSHTIKFRVYTAGGYAYVQGGSDVTILYVKEYVS